MNNSKSRYTVAVVGGDKRLSTVASLIADRGHEVRVFGLRSPKRNGIYECSALSECVGKSEIIILPLPVSKDGVYVISPDYSGKISLYDVLNCSRGSQSLPCNSENGKGNKKYILGGMMPRSFLQNAEALGFCALDYYSCESLQLKNAVPTAEGAVMTAMQSLDITLRESKLAIAGFGRIGKRLASLLIGFGADVTVLARGDEALAEAAAMGCSVYRLPSGSDNYADYAAIASIIDSSDLLFNTIPAIIFNEEILSRMKNKPVFIELASTPGGFDAEYARDIGFGITYAPSLPGRYAPVSAGKYIFDCLEELTADRGIKL